MTMNRPKIRCPKCSTVYSIDESQINIIGKKSAKCLMCGSRFFVENRQELMPSDASRSGVAFLQSYFEKRSGPTRREVIDRRRDVFKEHPSLNEFPNDIIPIFSSEGNSIIGHISPGRRQREDRRSGIERRQFLEAQLNTVGDPLPGYRLNDSSAMQIEN
jgi:predicted Zn finger-like uncharacterized protein